MADDIEHAESADRVLSNFDRLEKHLEPGSMAARLLEAYSVAQAAGGNASASLNPVVAARLAEVKGQNAQGQDQQD